MMMKWLAVVWLLIVAGIVLAADLGLAAPVLNVVNRVPYGDKLCHFVLVGGLCFVIALALARWRPRQAAVLILGTMLALGLAATLEELSQMFFVERTFSLGDLACNLAGIGFFGCLALWLRPRTVSNSS